MGGLDEEELGNLVGETGGRRVVSSMKGFRLVVFGGDALGVVVGKSIFKHFALLLENGCPDIGFLGDLKEREDEEENGEATQEANKVHPFQHTNRQAVIAAFEIGIAVPLHQPLNWGNSRFSIRPTHLGILLYAFMSVDMYQVYAGMLCRQNDVFPMRSRHVTWTFCADSNHG